MSDTTSLDDLPVRGVAGPPVHNAGAVDEAHPPRGPPIVREEAVSDSAAENNNNIHLDIDVDPTVMNKVVTDIRAHVDRQGGSNAIPLPERNIPSEPHIQSLLHDSASLPNYVPPSSTSVPRGVAGAESATKVLDKLKKRNQRDASLDSLFDDFKGIVFITILYYIFQTPYAHIILKRLFSFGYNEDGAMNHTGLLIRCVLFSSSVFLLNHAQGRIMELLA